MSTVRPAQLLSNLGRHAVRNPDIFGRLMSGQFKPSSRTAFEWDFRGSCCVIIGLLPFPVSTHTDLQLSFPPRSLPAPSVHGKSPDIPSLSITPQASLFPTHPYPHRTAIHGQTASELLPAMSWLFLGVINALSYILEAQPAPIDPLLHGQKTRCTSNTPQLPIKGNSPPHLPSITPKLILPKYIRKTRHYNGLGDGPNASKG